MSSDIGGPILMPDLGVAPELIAARETANADSNSAPVFLEPFVFLYQALDFGAPVSGLMFPLQVSDPDGDPLEFEIVGGPDADLFSIDPLTGQIRLESTIVPGIHLDADGDQRYVIEVTASDGQASATSTIEMFIDPGTIPNLAPFLIEPIVFFVSEGQTPAVTLMAIDPEDDPLHFAIEPGQDGDLFTLDPVTGELSVRDAADFETPQDTDADNAYLVTVSVSDDHDNTTSQTVTINVTDLLVPPPPIGPRFVRPDGLEPFEPVRAFFTSATSGAIMDLQLVDDASGFNDVFRLVGEDADRFSVDPGTGLISLLEDADLTSVGSFDGDAIYEILAVVDNAFGGSDTMAIDFLLFRGG